MTALAWDAVGARLYETGVDRGVLYIPTNGVYSIGYAWNGLTTVTESPDGAEATAQYADNIKYLNLVSAEDFKGTIEAFTYPDAFAKCDGSVAPNPGVNIYQQTRQAFGLAYRTKLGNDALATDFGYKLHLIYGALAAPSEKAFATVNDTPDAISFSWDITTTQVAVSGYKPTALLTVDSTKVTAANLTALETALYGSAGTDPRLPLPDEVIGMFAGTLTNATAVAPTYTAASHLITIPTTTGIVYKRADTNATVAGGSTITLTSGQNLVIYATPATGYQLTPGTDDDFGFAY